MQKFAIELKLYGPEDEEKAVYRQSFIPFRLLKEAVKLQKWIKELEDPESMDPEIVDSMADFIVAFYRNEFTRDDVLDGARLDEILTLLTQIMSMINSPNSYPPPQ